MNGLTNKFLRSKDINLNSFQYKQLMNPKTIKDPDNHYHVLSNYWYQCDLMYLPRFHNYEYCLCLINMRTKISDVEPIVNRTSKSITTAFIKMLERNIIEKFPKKIFSDLGSEFRGEFEKFCKDNNIQLIYTRQQNHFQNSLVENINGTYKKIIMRYLQMKKTKDWISILYEVRDAINSWKKEHPKKFPDLINQIYNENNLKNKYELGEMVHVKLDHPVDDGDKRIQGSHRIRHGMKRFSTKTYKIISYRFTPKTIRYTVQGLYGSYPESHLLAS